MQYDKDPHKMTRKQNAFLEAGPFVREGDNAARILAAEVERLRAELVETRINLAAHLTENLALRSVVYEQNTTRDSCIAKRE